MYSAGMDDTCYDRLSNCFFCCGSSVEELSSSPHIFEFGENDNAPRLSNPTPHNLTHKPFQHDIGQMSDLIM